MVIVRLANPIRMVTKGYQRGVYNRVEGVPGQRLLVFRGWEHKLDDPQSRFKVLRASPQSKQRFREVPERQLCPATEHPYEIHKQNAPFCNIADCYCYCNCLTCKQIAHFASLP